MNELGQPPDTRAETRFVRWSRPWQVIPELRSRNGILFAVATVHAVLLVTFVAGIVLDPRIVNGEPVWLKPARFAASIALFTATLGWIARHFPISARNVRRASIGIAVTALVEITLIGGQAGRGVESHFNDTTSIDQAIYVTMGVTILAMTALVTWLLVLSWRREFGIDPAFALGIRIGLALFVLGAFEGGVMVTLGTSAIGQGQSVPIAGWMLSGDFRVAHFVGLHALQLLPLVGYGAAIASERGLLERPIRFVLLVGGGYALVLVATFVAALAPAIR